MDNYFEPCATVEQYSFQVLKSKFKNPGKKLPLHDTRTGISNLSTMQIGLLNLPSYMVQDLKPVLTTKAGENEEPKEKFTMAVGK